MDLKDKITKDDAIFFLDMLDSTKSPNFVPRMNKIKPYYKLMKDKDSIDYKRFIRIFIDLRYVLPERELQILNMIYGLSIESATLKSVGQVFSITPERVRQLCFNAERKIQKELLAQTRYDLGRAKCWLNEKVES